MKNIIVKISDVELHYPTFMNKSIRSKLLKNKDMNYKFIHAIKMNLTFCKGEELD